MMPLRQGDYAPLERQAKQLAGGVERHDSQPWVPPIKVAIDYPVNKNRQTRIPDQFDWSPFMPKRKAAAYLDPKPWPAPPIPKPEGHRMPEGFAVQVVNQMSFDDKPWLDSAPIDVQAKAGYTNFANDLAAKGNPKPGEFWAEDDRKHRIAKRPKAADASQPPPKRLTDSLASLRGRLCRNCLGRIPADTHGKVRYCSDRCRDRGKYIRRRGEAGTVSPGVELSSYAVGGKRFGIDTDDMGFPRLLASCV
ncbi:hypothetical protein ACT18_04575 [Mycolicibacter kumamotonensis]|uniref:Uncharacterized protein n=2 Tax=Mycolicibacter kumamotonensis TaxID=354243 RepID=A0A1B8SK44_9MYCO|nr:hypothetical protein ACT18_04575 [Mycolicibacter kumamotonensis]